MSPSSRKWETLFVVPFFLVVVVLFLFLCFCFCFCVFVFVFAFVFVFFLLCNLDAISSKFFYLFIESVVKMTKPSKPWQKLISLRIVLYRRKL